MSEAETERVAVVTGANSGLGFVTARELSRDGFRVVMLCRDPMRASEALEVIAAETGRRPELLLCDVSDQDQVRRAGAQFGAQYDRLDVLVNNAGCYFPRRSQSAQGIEMTLAVNHLGYFLLTHELMPLLTTTPASRIVNVASSAHWFTRLKLDDLEYTRRFYHGFLVYGSSKLCNILFNLALARRLEGTDTLTSAVDPGMVRTGFARDEPGLFKILNQLAAPFLSSPERAAKTSLYCARSPKRATQTALYYGWSRPWFCSPVARDLDRAEALWERSLNYCGL